MFKLRIVTIEDVVADLEVQQLTVNTPDGATGILSGHIPLLTAVLPGAVRYSTTEKETSLVVTSGSLEIKDNQATLLVDEAIPLDEINVEQAQAERDRLLNILKSGKVSMFELAEARRELKNVLAKISVADQPAPKEKDIKKTK